MPKKLKVRGSVGYAFSKENGRSFRTFGHWLFDWQQTQKKVESLDFAILKRFVENVVMPWETAKVQVSNSGHLAIIIKGKDGTTNAEYGLSDINTLLRDTSL